MHSNIFRFAYIIAQNLLREHIDDTGKKLILIFISEGETPVKKALTNSMIKEIMDKPLA